MSTNNFPPSVANILTKLRNSCSLTNEEKVLLNKDFSIDNFGEHVMKVEKDVAKHLMWTSTLVMGLDKLDCCDTGGITEEKEEGITPEECNELKNYLKDRIMDMLCLKKTLDSLAKDDLVAGGPQGMVNEDGSTEGGCVWTPEDFLGTDGTVAGVRNIHDMHGYELYEFLNSNNLGHYNTNVWERKRPRLHPWDYRYDRLVPLKTIRYKWWWIDPDVHKSLAELSPALLDKLYNSQFFQDNVKDLKSLENLLSPRHAEKLGLHEEEMTKIIEVLYRPPASFVGAVIKPRFSSNWKETRTGELLEAEEEEEAVKAEEEAEEEEEAVKAVKAEEEEEEERRRWNRWRNPMTRKDKIV